MPADAGINSRSGGRGSIAPMNNAEYQHMLAKCRDAAAGGWDVQSTGEKLAAALVLNRPDWLEAMGYTIAEAIERVGPEWVSMIPLVAKQIQRG